MQVKGNARWTIAPARGRGPARPSLRRAAALAAMAGVALLAAACGGSSPSSATGGPARAQAALAHARCMPSHGVPDFPDPDSNGDFNLSNTQQGGASCNPTRSRPDRYSYSGRSRRPHAKWRRLSRSGAAAGLAGPASRAAVRRSPVQQRGSLQRGRTPGRASGESQNLNAASYTTML